MFGREAEHEGINPVEKCKVVASCLSSSRKWLCRCNGRKKSHCCCNGIGTFEIEIVVIVITLANLSHYTSTIINGPKVYRCFMNSCGEVKLPTLLSLIKMAAYLLFVVLVVG
jgi:hypothetical protein